MTVITAKPILVVEGIKALFGAEAVIRLAVPNQLFRIGLIGVFAFTLDIGAVFSAQVGAFVVLHAYLLERIVDHVHSAFYQPFLVGVFNPKHKLPVLGLGNQIFKQSRTQVSHMHKTGGAGGKASANRFVFHVFFLS